MNVDATVDEVVALAASHGAAISAIEPLIPKGTRVVFVRAEDARVIGAVYGARVLHGPVSRIPLRTRSTRATFR